MGCDKEQGHDKLLHFKMYYCIIALLFQKFNSSRKTALKFIVFEKNLSGHHWKYSPSIEHYLRKTYVGQTMDYKTAADWGTSSQEKKEGGNFANSIPCLCVDCQGSHRCVPAEDQDGSLGGGKKRNTLLTCPAVAWSPMGILRPSLILLLASL